MPGPAVQSITTDTLLPDTSDVVIIGGGIIGISAALYLAQKGISTVVCEKGRIAGEQSSRNWGWCRKQFRDERELPLVISSLRLWESMNERVGGDTGFQTCGIMHVAPNEKQLSKSNDWAEMAKGYQLDSRILSAKEIKALVPGLQHDFPGAIYTPSDGRAEPQKAVPAIAKGARNAGAVLLENTAVRGLERDAGRIRSVVTERGVIKCQAVIVAGGAWSRLFLLGQGISIPQLKTLSSVFRTSPLKDGPSVAAWAPDFAFRKREDGGYTVSRGRMSTHEITPDSFRLLADYSSALLKEWADLKIRFGSRFFHELLNWRPAALDQISPFEKFRVLDPQPDIKQNRFALQELAKMVPAFYGATIEQDWAGYIDVTPDEVPIIGAAPGVEGLYIATGMSGHGFGIGPAAGQLAAELATGAAPHVDAGAFSAHRF